MKIENIYNYLDSIAPFSTAFDWDNCGLLIGNIKDQFKKCLICLDVTPEIIDECIDKDCNLIISHHPIFNPHFCQIKKISSEMLIYKLIKYDINVICLHTNLDMAKTGINYLLAKKLNLYNLSPLRTESSGFSYKISIFIPKEYEYKFKYDITNIGAKIKKVSTPNLNNQSESNNNLIKIVAIVNCNDINNIINHIINSFPNIKIKPEIKKVYDDSNFLSLGLKGSLIEPSSPLDFVSKTKKTLSCKKISYIPGNKNIKTVAVCSGAGSDLIKEVIHYNIDAYVTAEIKYNVWLEAKRLALTLIDAGHYNTETIICEYLSKILNDHFKTDKFSVAQKNIDIIQVM